MAILSNMGVAGVVAAALTIVSFPARAADSNAELADIAARIDYGYYAGDERVIAGGRADLERLSTSAGANAYYLGYSAYRLSQLQAPQNRARRELLSACIDSARAALVDRDWTLEAWILIAACSLEGLEHEPVRMLSHDLRLTEALTAARALSPDHPRLLLVEALAEQNHDADIGQLRTLLVKARERFDAWQSRGIEPDWGRAEVLVELAELHLKAGERREARDLVEQALIDAPGYRFALEIKNGLSLTH